MSDLIDRQAAIDAIGKAVTKECAEWSIKELPTAQPERKTGTWEELTVDDNQVEEWQSARCSVCKHYQTMPYLYYFKKDKYCPNCGARMDLE